MAAGHPRRPIRDREPIGARNGALNGGFATIPWIVGLGVVVIPVAVVVLSLAPWYERAGIASLAAQEAARAAVLADDWDDALDRALEVVDAVERARCVDVERCLEFDISSTTPRTLDRGSVVTVEVTVTLPVAVIPFLGEVGGFAYVVSHAETVDPYRSLP